MKKIMLLIAFIGASTMVQGQQFTDLISFQGYNKTLTFDMNNSPSDVRKYRLISASAGIGTIGGATSSLLRFQSQTHNSWYTSMTINSNKIGIGTDYPQEIFDVNGTARVEKLIVDPPAGEGRYLQIGQDVGSDLRIFNFGTSGNYAGSSAYDTAGQQRYSYYHNTGITSLGLRDDSALEIFKVAKSEIGSYIHLPQAQSRIVISDFGSYRLNEGHKLVIKNGDALVEGDIISEGNIGIGTGDPLNKLQLGNSMSFHDGGNEVIGFGYAPGSNTDLNASGYSSEIRLNPTSGNFTLGVSSSTSNNPTANMIVMNKNGNVGIGTSNPSSKLSVNGKILAEEVQVVVNVPADYVFENYYLGTSTLKQDYTMPSLEEVEAYTMKNHHLPEIPSAKEIQEKGMNVGEMTNILLQKIEELTLYTIEQEKRIKRLEAQLQPKQAE